MSLGKDLNEASRKLRQIKRNDLPAVRLTVEQAAPRWLNTYVQNSRNEEGKALADARARKYLVPFMGWKLFGRVTPEDMRAYRNWLEMRTVSPKKRLSAQTVAHVLSGARCLFRWCEDAGHLDRNPVPRRLLPKIPERPPNRLSDEEVVLVAGLPGPIGFTVRLGLATGSAGARWLAHSPLTSGEGFLP